MAAAVKKPTASTLTIQSDDAKEIAATPAERIARHAATVATVQAAVAIEPWITQSVGEPDFTALANKISEQTDAMHSGDMKGIESMLFAQALTLQATFTALSRRAALNAGTHMAATDTYLRLALRAQGQCRATLETVANIKNPRPVAFVKQANIAHNQQVNNDTSDKVQRYAPARALARTENPQNELLTDTRATHGKPMDTRAKSKAGRSNLRVATVEAGHRAANS